MRMRVLLLGGESLLGQSLLDQAAVELIDIQAENRPEAGWLPGQIDAWLETYQPDALINMAYYHEQFQLGEQSEAGLAEQKVFAEHLIERCAERDCLLVMLSSARVFDGEKVTTYTEKDELAPADPLGALQADLEAQVQLRCKRHLVMRFSWLLDHSEDGLLGQLLAQLHGAEPLQLAEEWRGNPTPINDAARVILAVLKQLDCDAPLYGVYHYGGNEVSSWISFAKCVSQELLASKQLEQDPVVLPVPFSSQPMAGREPQNAALACRKILMAFGIKPRPWRAQLAALLER